MIETITALMIVLASIVLLRALLRMNASGPLRSRRHLRVVESVPLGTRQRLHIVEIDGQRLLIGSSEGSVRLVSSLATDEAEVVEGEGLNAPSQGESHWASWAWLRRLSRVMGIALLLVGLEAGVAEAAAPDLELTKSPRISISIDDAIGPDQLSGTLQIVALVTLVSVAPSILLMATCFTRVLIVMALVRQAVGIHSVPPNQVLVGLALFTTFYVMAPVGKQIHEDAIIPYMEREIDDITALERAAPPIRNFLLTHTREEDLELFLTMAKEDFPEDLSDVGFATLLPSFMISELRTAFEVGFTVFLPFLIIDIVIASMLISMGMIVLPPMMISLPFKLMLFVLLDGWNLVIGSLVAGLV
jgi:flagellar biosynthetic protein FliP